MERNPGPQSGIQLEIFGLEQVVNVKSASQLGNPESGLGQPNLVWGENLSLFYF